MLESLKKCHRKMSLLHRGVQSKTFLLKHSTTCNSTLGLWGLICAMLQVGLGRVSTTQQELNAWTSDVDCQWW